MVAYLPAVPARVDNARAWVLYPDSMLAYLLYLVPRFKADL